MKMGRKLRYSLAVILAVLGLALIFNGPISNFVIQHLMNTSISQKLTNQRSKDANFDFIKVEAISPQLILKAMRDKTGAIGQVSIPKVKMKLAIFYGISNTSLARGAGTMKKSEKMGQGNYALAGHHMSDAKVLFGPLSKTKKGMKIYLTNGKKVYIYRITKKVKVYKSQVQWINDVPHKKLITLVTCASATEGEVDRIIVRGKLIKTAKLTKTYTKYFSLK